MPASHLASEMSPESQGSTERDQDGQKLRAKELALGLMKPWE